jgi:hypothetical protein
VHEREDVIEERRRIIERVRDHAGQARLVAVVGRFVACVKEAPLSQVVHVTHPERMPHRIGFHQPVV